MRPQASLLLSVSLILGVHPPSAEAQTACGDCEVEFEHIVTLGQDDGFVSSRPSSIAQWRENYVVTTWDGSLPQIFSPAGAWLGEIGRRGEGPGEFKRPAFARAARADTLLIVDNATLRLSVMDEDLEYVRSHPWPGGNLYGLFIRWPRIVANLHIPTPKLSGYAIQEMTVPDAGEIPFQSVDLTERFAPQRSSPFPRAVRWTSDDSYWTTPRDRLELKRWLFGQSQVVDSISIDLPWLDGTGNALGTPDEPPSPFIAGIDVRDGLIWVYGNMVSENWRDGWQGLDVSSGEVRLDDIKIDDLFEGVVTVIDPSSSEVLHTQRWPGLFLAVLPGMIASESFGPNRENFVELWRVQLHR